MVAVQPQEDLLPAGDGVLTYDAVIVGTGPGWADGNEGTFASFFGAFDRGGNQDAAKAGFSDGTFSEFSGQTISTNGVSFQFGRKIANLNSDAITYDGGQPTGVLADNGGFFLITNETFSFILGIQHTEWAELVEGWNYSPIYNPETYSGSDIVVFGDIEDLFSGTGVYALALGPSGSDTSTHCYDITEVSLEVFPSRSGNFPLRRYPPVSNGGFGPTRHWPRTVNRRAGGTY